MPNPTPFDLASLDQAVLATRFHGHLHHLASVDSTNRLALDAAQSGARSGVWVADQQTAGRGRGGHQWHSAPGDGLYVSALVSPALPMSLARDLPLATGLAAQAAVLECTGLTLDLRWPNDLMFGDRKCGGILVESASDALRLRYAVIGVGLNLNHRQFPDDLAAVATSLWLEGGRQFAREPILASLLRHLDREIELLGVPSQTVPSSGVGSLYSRFTAASTWVQGKRVRVGEEGGYTGWTRGLDPQGFLQVEDDVGVLRTVLSGGVRSA